MKEYYKRQIYLLNANLILLNKDCEKNLIHFQKDLDNIESLLNILHNFNSNLFSQIYSLWSEIDTLNAVRLSKAECVNKKFNNIDLKLIKSYIETMSKLMEDKISLLPD